MLSQDSFKGRGIFKERGAHNATAKNFNPQVIEKMKEIFSFKLEMSFLKNQEAGGWNTAGDAWSFFLIFLWLRM